MSETAVETDTEDWAAVKLAPRLTGLPMAVWITENDGSHGHIRGQGVRFMGSWSSPAVGSDPRSEPISMTRCMPHQIKLTYGRRLLRPHQHPASGGWGSGGRDHSFNRLVRPAVTSVRSPGSDRTDQVLADGIRLSTVPPSLRPPR